MTTRKTKVQTVKQYIAVVRVSSREQKKRSLDVQEHALRAFAAREGGQIARLWRIAEPATRTEQRTRRRR